ncbi:phage portal protein [Microbacterium rhizophilus]|uniref:phage portal protein n=1 Tax=Microbacterium rhizophilus TaxID=3138934 RepID=UPI0031E9DB45
MPKIFDRIRDALSAQPVAVSLGDGRPLASPYSDAASLSVIEELYGLADRSDLIVTRGMAMGLSPLAKGRRVLATNLGRMSLVNTKGSASAPTMPYLEQPEADRPLSATLTWTADALYFQPCTWWIVRKRDAYGWPARGGIKLLDRADAQFDKDGKLRSAWGMEIGEDNEIKPRDVIQFDAPDGGLLADQKVLIRRAAVLNRAASLAEANPVPSVNLEYSGNQPLESDQIKDLLDSWVSARKKYGVAYTDKTIKAVPMSAAEAQLLLGGRKQMDLELARVAGAPAWALDVALEGSTLNYQNRASRAWELIDLFLATYMTPIATRLSMPDATPLGWRTTFNTDDLTRPDQKTRFETYKLGLDAGFIDQAWIEAQEGQRMKGSSL